MTENPKSVYATYIESTPERVWSALTDPELTQAYWAHRNVSDWRTGSPWEHLRVDGTGIADVAGAVVESTPPTRLVLTWANPVDGTPVAGAADQVGRARAQGPSRVTCEVEGYGSIVRLTVTHENLASAVERDALQAGWAAILSNLKSFLETGHPLPTAPWEMLAGWVRS